MNIISITELYEEIKNNSENIILINVLTETEFKGCHITGSINIPLSHLPSKLESLDRNKKIIVYGAHELSSESEEAYEILNEAGFTNLYDYKRGIREWIQSDLKTSGNCDDLYLHELDQKR